MMFVNKTCQLLLVLSAFSMNLFAEVRSEQVAVGSAPKESNLDYIRGAKDSSVDMLIKASEKYKTGAITKEQYIQIALQVSQMAEYYNKVITPAEAASKNTRPVSNDEMVLIGTADNGTSKIYSIKQNSWDTKYGYKVRIVPDKPIVSPYYDLTIPS